MKKAVILAVLSFFLACCGISLFPPPDDWFALHYIIMEDWERNFYKKLTDEGKKKFRDYFWEVREPESKQIFEERLDEVMKIYKKENPIQPWNNDRARIYLLHGPPFEVTHDYGPYRTDTEDEDLQGRIREYWGYPFRNYFVFYFFKFYPPNEWRLQPESYRDPFLIEFEKESKEKYFAPTVDWEQYLLDFEGYLRKRENLLFAVTSSEEIE